ncbi:hypothetical protein LZ575_00560 [Antarcticibacterium sp. 1MA-6-2]|uniref:hypothetical protein n=1 Tax=Antarcticibacterium sp. 1MA-6-2 TaxID=2908210 RepID=UPI001F351406|nr:hypothetical protein [Antarcticibacterium sp. 1MA-6-2]UJH91331.1 hypothetical protein LZ575_00560 [Antarcticibacterium sp. 1MA-6-2]
MTILESEAAAIPSWDEVRKLYQTLLAPGVTKYGKFTPSIDEIISQFQEQSIGDFTTTYTIIDGECSDSVDLTIKVRKTLDSPCSLSAGADNSITLTESEALEIPSWDEVRKLYLSLLDEGVSRQGTFDPSIANINSQFQNQRLGDFTTTYTIVEGDCSDTVNLTVTVVEDTPNCSTVDAGPDNMIILEESVAAAIPSWDEVRKLYLSLLAPGVSRLGTFDPGIQELINSFQAHSLGDFTTTYTLSEGECTDSVELTVRVIQDNQNTPTCVLK